MAETRRAKKNYELRLSDKIKTDPKTFYAYVRSKSKIKTKVGPLKDRGGRMVGDNQAMTGILNEYFAPTFTKENGQSMPRLGEEVLNETKIKFEIVEVSETKILNSIKKLQDNKAAGVDEFNSNFIK